MNIFRKPDWIIQDEDEIEPVIKISQYTLFYCILMTIIDFRYWFCGCHYTPPYGLLHPMMCKKHGIRGVK